MVKLATDLMEPRVLAQTTASDALRVYFETNLEFNLPSAWGLPAVRGEWWALAGGPGRAGGAAPGRVGGPAHQAYGGRATVRTRQTSHARGHRQRRDRRQGAARTWSRDQVRDHQLIFALSYGVCFAASPLVLGWDGMLPYAGPIFIVMAAAMTANLYGTDARRCG
ncbi:hypothetical protein AAH991_05570 [Microbispora sp. ZYX-F-249]|uniref:Uncharacterized protein n=1 Tax=Microbispora maris TaxID=3144104 RepID=A0ABV0AGU2_9ACTN